VLVVDDQEVFRRGLRSVLDREGFEVAVVADGEAALAYVSLFQPDVVVMDVNMPGMSGVEATRRLLRLAPRTAVVMLSMFDEEEMVDMAAHAGASDYLRKDARRDEILSAIREAASSRAFSLSAEPRRAA
jgi:DNA-binding NarL/FixJ family response regulator